ncbi:MAG: large-conductance mechanosensitive channel protein MscL [Pirellulaceae bacterium]|nr:large-conductance mechanosensitive channel protein MscL [Pirellulaceae bacterium]
MSLMKEFKEFAMRGNVVDLAVGVVIGGAFGKIVSSLVADIIMPPLNLLTAASGVSFKELAYKVKLDKPVMTSDNKEVSEWTVLNYGTFLQSVLDFLIVACAIFLAIKVLNSMKKKSEAAAPPAAPSEDVLLLREIRDAMQKSAPRRVD